MTVSKNIVHIGKIDGTDFYSLFSLDDDKSIIELRSELNGSKFISFEFRQTEDERKKIGYLIFPDVFSHVEAFQKFRAGFKADFHIHAISAGLIQCNPTHSNEDINLYGKSLSLQLGVEGHDTTEIRNLYDYLARKIPAPR